MSHRGLTLTFVTCQHSMRDVVLLSIFCSRLVDDLDMDTQQALMAAGEHGEALSSAMTQSNRDESYACAAALRLLRDRRGLSIHISVTSLSSRRSTSVVRP